MKPAGPDWCDAFPGSNSTGDLVEPFRSGVISFIGALRAAGAAVQKNATYRPPERAYLMHWCCLIAGYRGKDNVFHQIAPGDVPAMTGVDIDWTCGGDPGGARSAAIAMRDKFQIVYPAALQSRHTQRRAIDMTITWQGSILVLSKNGNAMAAAALSDLFPIGATYGVMKLKDDIPHWSDDGH